MGPWDSRKIDEPNNFKHPIEFDVADSIALSPSPAHEEYLGEGKGKVRHFESAVGVSYHRQVAIARFSSIGEQVALVCSAAFNTPIGPVKMQKTDPTMRK